MAGVFGDRHVIVTVTVTEETSYLSGLLASVTVTTLMTMICSRFLAGVPLIGQGLVAVHLALDLRRLGNLARLLQTSPPLRAFGHPLDQAQCGPRVTKSRVVGAPQLLVLVATPL